MNANLRSRHRATAIFVVLCAVSLLSGRALVLHGAQTIPAPDLDGALRSNDLDTARALIPVNWTAAEQLFVSYLDRAYTTPDPRRAEPDARALAARLAEVFFRISENDFESPLLAMLDGADRDRQQQLIDVTKDFFITRQRLRAEFGPGSTTATRTPEQTRIRAQFLEIADRFHALSFLRGELHTLRGMINLPDWQSSQAKAREVAAALGEDPSLARPYTQASLESTRRLGFVSHLEIILYELSGPLAGSADGGKRQQALEYLEEARALLRRIPALETVKTPIFSADAPRAATSALPRLWALYQKLQRPDAAKDVMEEALEISQPFGEAAQVATLRSFASASGASLSADQAEILFNAALGVGPRAGLAVLNAFGVSVAGLITQNAAAKTSVLLRLYDTLIPLCLSSGDANLVVDALADQAALQAQAVIAAAAATFTDAINRAEQAGDLRKAAQVANRALATVHLPVSARFEFANRAVTLATKADDPRELAIALRGRVGLRIGASDESLQDAQHAVAAAERHTATSGDFTEERNCLNALAAQHDMRGEYLAEIAVLERSAEKDRAFRAPAGSATGEVDIYQEITRVYSTKLGEPALALAASERVRQLLEPRIVAMLGAPDANSMGLGNSYSRMAYLYRQLRQPVAALDAWAKALADYRRSPPSLVSLNGQRSVLERRALYLTELGDYEAAQRDLDDILPLMPATQVSARGGPHYQKAFWLAEAVRVQALANNPEKAIALARNAITELSQDTSDVWFGGNNIDIVVNALLETGHADEAIDFCNSVFKKALAKPIAQPVLEKGFLESLARIGVKTGRFDEARPRLQAAIDIDRHNPTAEIGGLASSLLALGNLEISTGNYGKGKEALLGALAAVDAHDLNRTWQIERGLGLAHSKLGDAAGAESHYDRALTTLESTPAYLRPEEFELTYGISRWQIYEEYAGLLAASAVRSGLQADAERAFQAAERKRTQMLWSLLATGWSRVSQDAMPEQLRRAFDFESRIAAKQALLRAQSDLAAEKRDTTQIERLEADVKQVQADHARLLTSIAQGQYRYAAPTALAASLAAPVRAALGSPRVLLEYLVMDDRGYAFVVSQSGAKVVPLAVGRKQLREEVTHLLQPFQQLRAGEVDLARLTYDTRAAYALYQSVFAPVKTALSPASEILIVPDDVLNILPFEALVDRAPRSIAPGPVLHSEFSAEAFLIRQYAIGYLASAAQLLPGASAVAPEQPSKQLFAMANPSVGRTAPAPASSTAEDDPLKRQLRSGRFDAYFAPLPESEIEVARIAQYFARGGATILTGDKATKAAYKSQAGNYDIIHFATHAVASDGQPFYSTLILAPDGSPDSDGLLQAYEVLRTPLRARLVVLSGCETARGTEDWGQGLLGLVTAFEQAGAKSVLATLWSIDKSSADMMGAFYRAMAQGSSTPAALRQAKLDLLQRRVRMGDVEVSLAHPFFWAPFILVGVSPAK